MKTGISAQHESGKLYVQLKWQDLNVIYHTPTCPPASHMGPSSGPLVINILGCRQILERLWEGVLEYWSLCWSIGHRVSKVFTLLKHVFFSYNDQTVMIVC